MNYIRPVFYPFFLLILTISLVNLSGCKPKDLLLGKWKVVEMQSGEYTFTDDPTNKYFVNEFYFNFDKKGKVVVQDNGESNEREYTRVDNIIKDPERGENGDMTIDKLTDSELVFRGIGEGGKPFTLYLKRVKKN